MNCPYCGQRATVEIPSTPGHVCRTHAIEFWTSLVAYVRDSSAEFQTPEPPCGAPPTEESSARSSAERGVEPSAPKRQNRQIRLAS